MEKKLNFNTLDDVPIGPGGGRVAIATLSPADGSIGPSQTTNTNGQTDPQNDKEPPETINDEHASAQAEFDCGLADDDGVSAVEATIASGITSGLANARSSPDQDPHFCSAIASSSHPNDDPAGEAIRTVPWPHLNPTALQGVAGEIVNLVAPHTEADPPAILVQLLAVFGVTLGAGPHLRVGQERHQAIVHPLIVGRNSNGAKGTGLALVEAIRQEALPDFDGCTVSGLSTTEGLIETVRDASGDPESVSYDAGVADKRLLVKESEYKSVLVRGRRDGNTLAQTLRDCWDCRDLRTLTRRRNQLVATRPHIVVVGHVTPRELRATLTGSDLSGGSVNRMLICLSRRARLQSRLGNVPSEIVEVAARRFKSAHQRAQFRGEIKLSDRCMDKWGYAYADLNRDKPDCAATDATARGATQVLRLAMIYAIFDDSQGIETVHLDAALALWEYAEHSARWLFSNHELEQQRENVSGLAQFILDGGPAGRTRTAISGDFYNRNRKAAEISAELEPLIHDGVVIEQRGEGGPRPVTVYVHRMARTNEITNGAVQNSSLAAAPTNSGVSHALGDTVETALDSSEFVQSSLPDPGVEQHVSSDSLIRSAEYAAPEGVSPLSGSVTAEDPHLTPRVLEALAVARKKCATSSEKSYEDAAQTGAAAGAVLATEERS